MIVKNIGNGGTGTFSRGTPSDSALECSVKLAAVFDGSANSRALLRRLSDVAIDVACHLVAGAVAHVFMLSRLVPQLRLSTARTAKRDVQWHNRGDGMGQRINLGIVSLVFVIVSRRLALSGVP